jgi:hypothetical protein
MIKEKKFNFQEYFLMISNKIFPNYSLANNLQALKEKILDCKKKKKKLLYSATGEVLLSRVILLWI